MIGLVFHFLLALWFGLNILFHVIVDAVFFFFLYLDKIYQLQLSFFHVSPKTFFMQLKNCWGKKCTPDGRTETSSAFVSMSFVRAPPTKSWKKSFFFRVQTDKKFLDQCLAHTKTWLFLLTDNPIFDETACLIFVRKKPKKAYLSVSGGPNVLADLRAPDCEFRRHGFFSVNGDVPGVPLFGSLRDEMTSSIQNM